MLVETPGRRIPTVSSLTIEPVAKTSQPRVIATLVSAFVADPVERWLYPEPFAYLTQVPAFVAAFAGTALENGAVWSLDGFGPWRCGCLRVPKRTLTRSSVL